MRLGKLTAQTFSCTVITLESACDECPQQHMGLPLYDEAVRPAMDEFHDWDSCMAGPSSSSSVFELPDWWVDVRLRIEAPTNWVCVKSLPGAATPFPSSSSSSTSEEQECECITYGQFDPYTHQICGGPYPTEQECSSMRCGDIERNTSLLLNFNKVVIPDEHFSDISMFLDFDGSFQDIGPNNIGVQPDSDYPAVLSTERGELGNSGANFIPARGYLRVNGGTHLNLGSGDFTVEAWVYNRNTSAQSFFLQMVQYGTQWFLGNKGLQGVGFGRDSNWEVLSNSPMPARRWTHVAVCRSGNTLRLFLDGVISATNSTTSSFGTESGSNLYIGGNNSSFDGKIDELRITKGVARYAFNFEAPKVAFPNSSVLPDGDPNFDSVSLLIHTNGPDGSTTFQDSGPKQLTVQNPQNYWYGTYVQVSSRPPRGKYGRDSAYMCDTAFYSDSSPELAFGTGDFTIESWVYIASSSGTGVIYDGLRLNAVTITPHGNARISTSQSRFGGASCYFDAVNGSYLSLSDNIVLGLDDFTIEFWCFPSKSDPSYTSYKRLVGTGANTNFLIQKWDSGGNTTFGALNIGLAGYSHIGANTPEAGIHYGQWNHIAVSRKGGVVRGFVNGAMSVSITNRTSYVITDPLKYIGQDIGSYTEPFGGYIDEFRVTKGVARYVVGFNPPTVAFTGSPTASLLLHMDGSNGGATFTDSSPNALVPVVLGNSARVYTSTDQSKFGGSSLRTVSDNNTQYGALKYQHPDLAFGTGDFTVELWFRQSAPSRTQALIDMNSSDCAGDGIMIVVGDPQGTSTTGTIGFRYVGCYGVAFGSASFTFDEWHHVAVSRKDGVLATFLDGVEFGTRPHAVNLTNNTIVVGGIAANGPSWAFFDGYIDELRIVKGTAVYSPNITPPSAAFPDDPTDPHIENVSLLFHMDGTEGSTSFENSSPNGTGNRTNCFAWELLNDGTRSAIHYDGQPHFFNNDVQVPINTWTHQAIARKDGVLYRYSDGSLVGWQPFTLDITQGNCVVGRFSDQYSGTLDWYIDNYRITKGMARYFPEFTPPSQPFQDPQPVASSSSSFAGDPYLSKVWAIAHFDAPEGSTSFSDGSPNGRTISADGYGYGTPIVASTAMKRFGSSSAFFPPNPGYYFRFIQVDFPQSLNGDFAIECWFRPTTYQAISGGHQSIFSSIYMHRYGVAMDSSGLLGLWIGNASNSSWGVANGLLGQNPVSLNSWNHIALVRSGSAISVYLNGQVEVQVDPGTASSISSYNLAIGYWPDNTRPINNGYIDEFRATIGLARYTASFQPPASPFPTTMDPDGDTLVLLHMDGYDRSTKFVDSGPLALSPYPYSAYNPYAGVYNAETRISTIRSKVGSASGRFSTSSPWYEPRLDMGYENRDLSLGSADFTIECWLRLEDNVYNSNLADTGYSGWSFTLNGSAGYGLGFGRQYGGPTPLVDQSRRAPVGRWFHAAVTRNNGVLRLFMDGVKVAEKYDTFSYTVPDTGSLKVSVIQGHMDEFRIKKGKADYISDFEPVPTRHEGPDHADMLLLHFDESVIVDSAKLRSSTLIGGASTSPDNKRFGSSSLRLQAYGQRLDFAQSHSFDIEGSDYTIECFLYLTEWTGSGSSHPIVWAFEYGNYWTGSSAALTVLNDGSGTLRLLPLGGSPMITTPNNTISLNTWHHVALAKRESTAVLYVDGKPKGSTSAQVFSNARNQLSIGGSTIRFPYSNLRGYIDEFRVTKNLGRYGGDFYFESEKYLIVDSSGNDTKITSYGAEVASDRSKHGSYSCYLKGGGVHLVAEGDSIPLGTDDFTLEFWVRPEEFPSYTIASTGRGAGDDSGFGFTIEASNPEGGIRMIDDDGAIIVSRSQALSEGKWTHLAFARKSSVVKLFVDGHELGQGLCLGDFTSRFLSIGRNDFSPEETFRGHIDDFRLVKGIAVYDDEFDPPQYQSENYYGGLSATTYCIPLSTYDEAMHEICAGPHPSRSQCGQCEPPPPSSSSSGAPTCTPKVTVITLPNGSTTLDFECGEPISPSSSSTEFCLESLPSTHDIYCPDGTKIGNTFYLPNFDSCSWTPFDYVTGVCPDTSSSSSPTSCLDQKRYCLYSDYPSKMSFSMLNKPPPCDDYEYYCLPTGCDQTCRAPEYTSVTGCGEDSSVCCSPGYCFHRCTITHMGNCIGCAVDKGPRRVWIQTEYESVAQQYLEDKCRLECWECLEPSKTCNKMTFLALDLVDFGNQFGVDPLDVTCDMIAYARSKTYHTSRNECNDNCGCCCANNTTATNIKNRTDCERGSPSGDWYFGEICPMSWNCDPSVGPKEVCDKSGEFSTESAVRTACREVWFCSTDGPAKTGQWSTVGPFEEDVRAVCLYTFDCETDGCHGYWRNHDYGFSTEGKCGEQCLERFDCLQHPASGCTSKGSSTSGMTEDECAAECGERGYQCYPDYGCQKFYGPPGDPLGDKQYPTSSLCDDDCKERYYCNPSNGCSFLNWDTEGQTHSECEQGTSCLLRYDCNQYWWQSPQGCVPTQYGPTGMTRDECIDVCPADCVYEQFVNYNVPDGTCGKTPYGLKTITIPSGFALPVQVTITGSSDDDFLVNGSAVPRPPTPCGQPQPGDCVSGGDFPSYTFTANMPFTIAAGNNQGTSAGYSVTICFLNCPGSCPPTQIFDTECKCVCPPGMSICNESTDPNDPRPRCYPDCDVYGTGRYTPCDKCTCWDDRDLCNCQCYDKCTDGYVRNKENCNCECPQPKVECNGVCYDPCEYEGATRTQPECKCIGSWACQYDGCHSLEATVGVPGGGAYADQSSCENECVRRWICNTEYGCDQEYNRSDDQNKLTYCDETYCYRRSWDCISNQGCTPRYDDQGAYKSLCACESNICSCATYGGNSTLLASIPPACTQEQIDSLVNSIRSMGYMEVTQSGGSLYGKCCGVVASWWSNSIDACESNIEVHQCYPYQCECSCPQSDDYFSWHENNDGFEGSNCPCVVPRYGGWSAPETQTGMMKSGPKLESVPSDDVHALFTCTYDPLCTLTKTQCVPTKVACESGPPCDPCKAPKVPDDIDKNISGSMAFVECDGSQYGYFNQVSFAQGANDGTPWGIANTCITKIWIYEKCCSGAYDQNGDMILGYASTTTYELSGEDCTWQKTVELTPNQCQ